MSELSTEERVERVRMALAEAGYPDRNLYIVGEAASRYGLSAEQVRKLPEGKMIVNATPVPDDVWWRALAVSGSALCCWPCFQRAKAESSWVAWDCTHDPLTSPWPPLSSRETAPGSAK